MPDEIVESAPISVFDGEKFVVESDESSQGDTDGDDFGGEDVTTTDAESVVDADEDGSTTTDLGTVGEESSGEESESSGLKESLLKLKEGEEKEGTTDNPEQKPQLKPVKAKAGDKIIDVPVDAVFDVKVDGEKRTVTTRELLDGFSSKEANKKAYRQLEKESKQFAAQKEQFEQVINDFAAKSESGEVINAVMGLIAASGKEALPIIQNLRESILEHARPLLEMSPEERKQIYALEEAEYYKKRTDQFKQAEAEKIKQAQLEAKVQTVMSDFGIPDEDSFVEAGTALKAYIAMEQSQGRAQGVTLTPELVGQWYQNTQLKNMVDRTLSDVAPQVLKDFDEYSKLAKMVKLHNPSEEELRQVLKEIYSSSSSSEEDTRSKPLAKSSGKKLKPTQAKRIETSADTTKDVVERGLGFDPFSL